MIVNVALLILLACIWLLVRTFAKDYYHKLVSRRNVVPLCVAMLYFAVVLVLYETKLFDNISIWYPIAICALYIFYLVIFFISVDRPIFAVKRYLKQCDRWIEEGEAIRHLDSVLKRPWYVLDIDDVIRYKLMRVRFLHEAGNYSTSCSEAESIDERMLYPEERTLLTQLKVVMLIFMGNIDKAQDLVAPLKAEDPVVYYHLQSYFGELQGDMQKAYEFAVKSENAIHANYKNKHAIVNTYTNLGRMSCFRENETEVFRYYRKALNVAKELHSIRQYHIVYPNYITQMQLHQKPETQIRELINEYADAIEGTSLPNQMQLENFRVAMARRTNNREIVYQTIMDAYHRLHSKADLDNRNAVEASTSKMLCGDGFRVDAILEDIVKDFPTYFQMPMPARVLVLLDLSMPTDYRSYSHEHQELFEAWAKELVVYAHEKALPDLDEYENGLVSDQVNERAWVLQQKIDFIRKSDLQYDFARVKQLAKDLIDLYRASGQLCSKIQYMMNLLGYYDEQLIRGLMEYNELIESEMLALLEEAYQDHLRLPAIIIGNSLIELAYFSLRLQKPDWACEVYEKIHKLNIPMMGMIREMQEHYRFVVAFFENVEAYHLNNN